MRPSIHEADNLRSSPRAGDVHHAACSMMIHCSQMWLRQRSIPRGKIFAFLRDRKTYCCISGQVFYWPQTISYNNSSAVTIFTTQGFSTCISILVLVLV